MAVDIEHIWAGLYARLTAASDFYTAFSTRVYLGQAPGHPVTYPYAVVTTVSDIPLRSFPKNGYEILYQISMWATLDGGAQAASGNGDKLRAQVDRTTWSATGQAQMAAVVVAERGPDRDGESWRYDIDIRVMGYES